jgi:hypothetical protein
MSSGQGSSAGGETASDRRWIADAALNGLMLDDARSNLIATKLNHYQGAVSAVLAATFMKDVMRLPIPRRKGYARLV